MDAFGSLFGVRRGKTIKLLATHGQAGLEPLGAFASRQHGGVCLTEEDLQRFDKAPASAMVVVSGESAGFFIRDTTGTIGAVCNYREVAVSESERRADPPAVAGTVVRPGWPWIEIAVTAMPRNRNTIGCGDASAARQLASIGRTLE